MAKNNSQPKARKSVAIHVINILFIVAAVLAVIVPVLMFTPVSHSLKTMLSDKQWAISIAKSMNDWVNYHIVKVFHLSRSFRGHGYTFTSCFYLYIMYFTTIVSLFMVYLPFLLMHRHRIKEKTQVWRFALCWIAFGFLACCFAAIASSLFSKRLSIDLGGFYTWILSLASIWAGLFKPNAALNFLVIERISKNTYMWALFWLFVMIALIEFILLFVSCLGKAKQTADKKEEALIVEEKPKEIVENTPVEPIPVLAVEEKKEEISKLIPTIRELALLDSLNPLYETKIEILPDLEEENKEQNILEELEPVNKIALSEKEKAEVAITEAEDIKKALTPEEKTVLVLPGIDEWNADPWPEEEHAVLLDNTPTLETELTEACKEEKEEEIPVEELKQEYLEESAVEENQDKVEQGKVVALNALLEDHRRPQEETNEAKEEITASDRSSFKEIVTDNTYTPITTKPVVDENTWIIPTYVEEKKEESKPAVPPKANPRVIPVGLKQFDPSKKERRDAPIRVINPIKKEEKKEEPVVEEKKVAAPISGPLHSIDKSKHEKIEAVKPRHVAFSVKKYTVKTYEGDITAMEAFNMGVTKVQPTVNPVFANQTNEPAWKEKKRKDEIRSNGYGEVTQVEKLTGKAAPAISQNPKKATSIRDLIKAKKQEATKQENEQTEEKKIVKPIAPISFKPVEKKEAAKPTEETKESVPSAIKPIAPIKPIGKRPDIKPIKPIAPIKPKK